MSASHPSTSEVAEDLDLSAEAIALLEFTTDRGRPGSDSQEPFYITSKDAFLWAGIAISIARSASKRLENIDLLACLYDLVRHSHYQLRVSYERLPLLEQLPRSPIQIPRPGDRGASGAS